jgi:hypothetical protein
MQIVTETLHGEGFGRAVTSYQDGGQVSVVAFGRVVASWPAADPVARDVFIAAALRQGWRGTTVAALAFCAPSWVSRVRTRVALGGFAALAQRSHGGRPATLTVAQRTRAEGLRATGLSIPAVAARLKVSRSVIGRALQGIKVPGAQDPLALAMEIPGASEGVTGDAAGAGVGPSREGTTETARPSEQAAVSDAVPVEETPSDDAELEAPRAGEPLPEDGAPHACRYAGTVLAIAALHALGLAEVLAQATVQRPETAVYPAHQVMVAISAAWAAGQPSLEAMHDQDPFALGGVLGLERSPSVRTLHRAVAQMVEAADPIQWWAGWMTALMRHHPPDVPVFGVDGHFQRYSGEAPVDKGWNTKRRLAEPGLMTVRVTDLRGQTVSDVLVPAGDALSAQVLSVARSLDAAQACAGQPARPIVLAFDRGGFAFDALNALAAEGYWYLAWVPGAVNLPALDTIAPPQDGVGEQPWTHATLTHPARLLVERDAKALLPAATNLPPLVDTATAFGLLRSARGMQENAIKSARAFAHIDRLNDRGVEAEYPDARLIDNPARQKVRAELRDLSQRWRDVLEEKLVPKRPLEAIKWDGILIWIRQVVLTQRLPTLPTKVARTTVDPEARRATLDVQSRQLLHPLKNALENARRWLLDHLDEALAPTDHAWDQQTRLRTLTALLRAPGTLRFLPGQVEVTLDFPLPPTPHRRLAAALVRLDDRALRFSDGIRTVRFRLAPRPVRPPTPAAGFP